MRILPNLGNLFFNSEKFIFHLWEIYFPLLDFSFLGTLFFIYGDFVFHFVEVYFQFLGFSFQLFLLRSTQRGTTHG